MANKKIVKNSGRKKPNKKASVKTSSRTLLKEKKIGKNKAVLPKEIKKILAKKQADLLFFDNSSSNKVLLLPKKKNDLAINVASSPLDFYSSPHILNLAQFKSIEKTLPKEVIKQLQYEDLPGGKLLSKLKVFDFFILENSEILKFFKKSRKKNQTKFTPFIQAENTKVTPLKGLSLVMPFVYLWHKIFDLIKIISISIGIFKIKSNYFFSKDEEINMYGSVQAIPLIVDKPKENLVEKIPKIKNTKKIEKRIKKSSNENYSYSPMLLRVRGVIAFACFCLLFIIPFYLFDFYKGVMEIKGQVLGEVEMAIGELTKAKEDFIVFNLDEAAINFTKAGDSFIEAQGKFAHLKYFYLKILQILPFKNQYKSATGVLEIGKRISFAGKHLTDGLKRITSEKNEPLTNKLKYFDKQLSEVQYNLKIAEKNIKNIDFSDIPENKKEEFADLQTYIPTSILAIQKVKSLFSLFLELLADNDYKRYLVIFQNDNELRATGGFMGSFALIDVKSGKISSITLPEGGIYDININAKDLWKSPKPLSVINPKWQIQDANWWPDFPKSAKNTIGFYNRSGGPTVDGLIAINSTWLGEILKVIGPINMESFGKEINSENFELELQKSIELEAEEKNKPKKILSELAPVIIKKIFDIEAKKVPDLATALLKGLYSKDIQIYLKDEDLQKIVAQNNWDGSQKNSPLDYLGVVYTNIGGGKTDAAIKQNIFHKAEIYEDGTVINTVLLERSHIGPLDNYFTNKSNREYVRFYVPKGSEIISAQGFNPPMNKEFKKFDEFLNDYEIIANESIADTDIKSQTVIYDEGEYSVFGNWVTLSPGKKKESVIKYKLPFKLSPEDVNKYVLLLQKQSGLNSANFSTEILYPKNWNAKDYSGVESNNGVLSYTGALDGDKLFWINFTR